MTDSHSSPSGKLSSSLAKRIGLAAVVGFIAAGTLASLDAHAKRMGGGRTVGRQTQTMQSAPSRTTAPTQQPGQSGQAMQAQRTQPAQPAPGAPAPQRSRWLGPIAGLAAGLGIAALLSHFGLGGAFAGMMANVIVIALLAMAGIWIVRKLMSRRRSGPVPAYGAVGAAGSGVSSAGAREFGVQQPVATTHSAFEGAAGGYAAPAAGATPLPAGFDADTFLRHAKVNFVRLQAAWDEGNLADIREFTTPEMFAELKVDIDARKERDQTDVVKLDADLIGVEDRGSEYLASVRFSGLIRETAGGAAEPFAEVWNLSKSAGSGEGWLLAGIQQVVLH